MLDRLETDDNFLKRISSSDEAAFHVSGEVNRYNVRVWGSKNLHFYQENTRNSEKVRRILQQIDPSYMLENFAILQL